MGACGLGLPHVRGCKRATYRNAYASLSPLLCLHSLAHPAPPHATRAPIHLYMSAAGDSRPCITTSGAVNSGVPCACSGERAPRAQHDVQMLPSVTPWSVWSEGSSTVIKEANYRCGCYQQALAHNQTSAPTW